MKKITIKEYYTFIALIIIMIGMSICNSSFLNSENLSNLAKQVTINGILSLGMTLVILTGGIDLSIGSIVAFSGMIVGILQVKLGWSNSENFGLSLLTCLTALLGGSVLGLINGLFISLTKIPPFIITLGMMQIARGFSQIFLHSTSLSPMNESIKNLSKGVIDLQLSWVIFGIIFLFFLYQLFKNRKFTNFFFKNAVLSFIAYAFLSHRGIPVPIIFLVFSFVCLQFILERIPMGRYIYALGGNEQASLLSGLPVKRVKLFVYFIMGLLSGLAGILLTARINSADPNAGLSFELDAIAAVVIGGTSLTGGRGSLLGTLVGAMIISTINNGMSLMGVDSIYQMVIKGIILIAAVWLDSRSNK